MIRRPMARRGGKRACHSAPLEAPASTPAQAPVALNAPSLLEATKLVCRSRTKLSELSHVALLINDFADSSCSRWTLESVSEKAPDNERSTRLLDRLLVHEWSGLDAEFRHMRFSEAVERASLHGKQEILDWWLTKYLPADAANLEAVVLPAIKQGRVKVFEWLEHKRVLPDPLGVVFTCSDANVAYWLHDRGYKLQVNVGLETRRNNLNFLKWVHEHVDEDRVHEIEFGIVGAASVNNVEMEQWFTDTYPETEWYEPDARELSVCDLNMIKWLEENFKWKEEETKDDEEDDDDEDEDNYEENSDSEEYGNHSSWINCTMHIATNAGQLDVIQYLYDHPSHKPTCRLIFNAAENGHMEVVKWLHKRQPECSESAIGYAVNGGHLVIAKWLHQQIVGLTHQHPHPQELAKKKWEHDHKVSFSIDVAAGRWTLEMVQWLHINRLNECTTKAIDAAAANGKLDIVQWIHANRSEGCTDQALEGAVRGGHLTMVVWLLEYRSECKESISTESMDLAAQEGHLEIVKWLHKNRSEGCTTNAVDVAARNGHLAIVKFLLENRTEGCTSKATDEAASNGHLEIVQYLLVTRSECCTTSAMDGAAANGHCAVVRWLHNNRSEGCTPEAIDLAVKSNHVDVVKFLYENCNLRCTETAIIKATMKNTAAVEWVLKHDPDFSTFKFDPSNIGFLLQ